MSDILHFDYSSWIIRAICNKENQEGRTDGWAEDCFLSPAVWSGLCCLVGSSTTVEAWPGHTGAGLGQRGESKGAQHCTDASPTTMSHFRPLWFGLRGWPSVNWSSLSSSLLLLSPFLFFSLNLLPLSLSLIHVWVVLSLYPVNLFPLSPLNMLTVLKRLIISHEVEEQDMWREHGYSLTGGRGPAETPPPLPFSLRMCTHTHTRKRKATTLQKQPPPKQGLVVRAQETSQGNRYLRWMGECGCYHSSVLCMVKW